MKTKFKIFIHLGYPKTGTTYLQNYIFNNLTNVNYIGINNKFDRDLYFIRKSILQDDDKQFQKKISFLRTILKKKLKKNMVNIYSDEHFLIPTDKGYKRNIQRIKKLFLEFKNQINIMIFIRKPSDLILSIYKETVKIKKLLKIKYFNDFLDRIEKNKLNNNDRIFLNHYNFLETKKIIKKELTKKIKIYNFDDFRKNQTLFTKKFLKNNNFKINAISIQNINKNLTTSHTIIKKHSIDEIQNKKIYLIFARIFNKILSIKFKYFIKDKIFLLLFGKKEYVNLKNIYIIDEYFRKLNKTNY
tara:strand:+ start:585 stop:1487 length:903 start_codon:yes stop_codon:yes gene_type:complete